MKLLTLLKNNRRNKMTKLDLLVLIQVRGEFINGNRLYRQILSLLF